jgi:SnoaL-like protein
VSSDGHAEFVERFAAGWAAPERGDRLIPLLHPEVRLVQPVEGEVRGHAGARGFFDRTFDLIPDLRGEVLRWASGEDLLLIELRLYGTLAGGRPVEWVTSDHIRLEDGLVRERIARFDPTPLLAAALRSPRAWPALVRGNLARLRGR